MFNYENYLTEKLNAIALSLGFDNQIYVGTEQAFAKMQEIKPNSILAIIKYLQGNTVYQVTTQPIQLMILAEENSVEQARAIFSKFATDYNLVAEIISDTYLKQNYNQPTVMSNFNPIQHGKRSLLYMSGDLYFMQGVIDVRNFTINGIAVKPLNLQINYSMTGNTQPTGDKYIATTEKNVASLNLSFNLPFLNIFTKQSEEFTVSLISGEYEVGGITYNYKYDTQTNKDYEKIIDFIGYSDGEIIQNPTFIVENGIIYTVDIPMCKYKIKTNLVYHFLAIMKGSASGNTAFLVSFTLDEIEFTNIPMKLMDLPITTAPGVPSGLKITLQE